MLVLGRRVGEAILLDGGIRVVVLSADRRGVRLGIEAPAATQIQREELVMRVAGENRRAGSPAGIEPWVTLLSLPTPSPTTSSD